MLPTAGEAHRSVEAPENREVAVVQIEHAWSVLIAVHALAASFALVFGAANIIRRPKGDRPHRLVGRIWAGLMYFTALSSFFIQTIRPGRFSWIHALSALTLVTLSLALWHARRREIRAHAANMIGTYIGLWGAFIGVVAVPHRLVPQAFQANWAGMGALTLGIILASLVVIYTVVTVWPSTVSPTEKGPATRERSPG